MSDPVRIKFWGTRGAIARPGPSTLRYGGNTSCVEITSAKGTRVIIDCGTGAYDLGHALSQGPTGTAPGRLLISHTHWDHIQGFPFFAPLFAKGGTWDIYGPTGLGRSLRDALAGQMEHTYFPVTLEEMGAHIRFHDLAEGRFEIDDIHLTTRYLNHTALTLGYRLDLNGVSIVYACDHEPFSHAPGSGNPMHELDRRHSEFLAEADLIIHDAQYTDREYLAHRGWGHSPVEYVCEMSRHAGAKQLALTHHDPSRTDDELDAIVAAARRALEQQGSTLHVFAAADGQVLDLSPDPGALPFISRGRAAAVAAPGSAINDPLVLIGCADEALADLLTEAAESAGVHSVRARDQSAIAHLARQFRPPLVILEDAPDQGLDGVRLADELRSLRHAGLRGTTIVMMGDREHSSTDASTAITQWLPTPVSVQYARAQLQAWLLRTHCRWVRPPRPPDEEARLATLHQLAILDTPPEERFDRLTRLAATVSDVPIALISLVDRDRQWFKSCLGLSDRETPREVSFCAHVLMSGSCLVVPDTLLDERFADNPLVTSGPHIRFYAGFPVFHPNGSCVGTLCLIDTRPRQLPPTLIHRLEDLALLVQNELLAGHSLEGN